ncbi:TPA: DUF87 domain-containing protein, partial [Candidatus Bathyarchaeota archaeon]|nr:DUF87 domain-containing protein [Candidatus Bathyarchaeota archaeon]
MTALDIAGLDDALRNNVLLRPEVIQRHIFIGGTTGSGKSYATGIILEQVNRGNLRTRSLTTGRPVFRQLRSVLEGFY